MSRHAVQGLLYLKEYGLQAGVDYTLVEFPGLNMAVCSVQNHQSVLAVMAPLVS